MDFDRCAIPVAGVLLLLGLGLRLLVHRRRSGTWAVAFLRRRGASPLERALSAAFGLLVLTVAAWIVVYAWQGPAALGVSSLGQEARILGWGLVAASALLMGVAQAHMGVHWRIGIDDAPTGLVTGGTFALVRNPIYTGMVLSVAGVVLVAPSVPGAVLCVLVAAGVALQARVEERHLLALHGDAYRGYARRVGRFVPLLGRFY